MSDPVRGQYEAYPYPERDPAAEDRRLITGSPSHLDEVNHYVFAGRRDFTQPFRALVAGGGTGDAAIMLAQQLADAGGAHEVVYLDLSAASRAIAEARAARRGLANIRFLTGSLLDLADLAPGPYDYIDCCGVLHHLEDPAAGLRALAGQLGEPGGIGLMLYGELGRTGVYPLQTALRALTADEPAEDRVALARRVLAQLPETNWLRRNPLVADHLTGGDAGLYDLLLHGRDRAYRVPEVITLADGAGLAVAGFLPPALYEPASLLSDPVLLKRIAALPAADRWALAELLAGTMKTHVAYLVPAARAGDSVARADGADAVPVLRDDDGAVLAAGLKPGGTLRADQDGLTLSFPLPRLTRLILERIDGRASLGDIHRGCAAAGDGDLDWAAFKRQFDQLHAALGGLGKMLIRRPG